MDKWTWLRVFLLLVAGMTLGYSWATLPDVEKKHLEAQAQENAPSEDFGVHRLYEPSRVRFSRVFDYEPSEVPGCVAMYEFPPKLEPQRWRLVGVVGPRCHELEGWEYLTQPVGIPEVLGK